MDSSVSGMRIYQLQYYTNIMHSSKLHDVWSRVWPIVNDLIVRRIAIGCYDQLAAYAARKTVVTIATSVCRRFRYMFTYRQ